MASGLAISASVPTEATLGTAFTGSLSASGGIGPYAYSLISGTLPPGLTLNAQTGAITGIPTNANLYASITFQVTDGYTIVNFAPISIDVVSNAMPSVTLNISQISLAA